MLDAVISMLPINNPIARTAFPEFVTSCFQTKVRSQFVDGKRFTCERVGFASLKMLINGGALV